MNAFDVLNEELIRAHKLLNDALNPRGISLDNSPVINAWNFLERLQRTLIVEIIAERGKNDQIT